MRIIGYETYLDKVYGCYLGKCIAGTIGAPYEGMKELLDVKFNSTMMDNMIPNDDLDLQILWLSVVEKKGINFNSDDLAEVFLNRCPYSPGEYAIFKKNYRRGIHPPMSGLYNNRYYMEGMGCPIRSEIWACIAPGNPQLAAELAARDGVMDHYGNSVYAEQFLAGVEAAAFYEDNLDKLFNIGLELIPSDSRIACLIRDVIQWCNDSTEWKKVRSRLIGKYGHPDCTNVFQNIGFIILALYFGKMNFIETTMLALNCGFDTDCSCASAGAILGTILGTTAMKKAYGFYDQGFILGVTTTRRSDRILDLAEDICRVGMYVAKETNLQVCIERPTQDVWMPEEANNHKPMEIAVEYQGMPVIGAGDERLVYIKLKNTSKEDLSCLINLILPQNLKVKGVREKQFISAGGECTIEACFSIPVNVELVEETNIITLKLDILGKTEMNYSFGLVGGSIWKVFGPFWENNFNLSNTGTGESYMDSIHGEDMEDTLDKIRDYHLNSFCNFENNYLNIDKIINGEWDKNAEFDGCECRNVNICEDKFSLNEVIGFQGPCVVYMVRDLVSPDDRMVDIQLGHTDAFEFWLNGRLIKKKNQTAWWTAENVHILDIPIKKGINRIVLKLGRHSEKADFSIGFQKKDGGMLGTLAFPEHITDFASKRL